MAEQEPSTPAATSPAPLSGALTPEHIAERQRLFDEAFEQLDLYATSRRFRDKIERSEGSLEWSRKQFEILILVCNEYSLISWKMVMCHPDEAAKRTALSIIAGLSQISQRYATSLAAINLQISKEPPRPGETITLPPEAVRLLPVSDWEAMFSDDRD